MNLPTIARNELTAAIFVAAAKLDVSLNSKLAELATKLAAEVAEYKLPMAKKMEILEEAYKADFKALAANRNTVASLRAVLACKVAGDQLVEVKAPSKDGKAGAILKHASGLSVGEAKKHAAAVKETAKEAERSPEEAARIEAQGEAARAVQQADANKRATEAAQAKAQEAFAYVLADAQRAQLVAQLAGIGYKLAKLTTAPSK